MRQDLADYISSSWRQNKLNLSICKGLKSFSPPIAHGLILFIWCPRKYLRKRHPCGGYRAPNVPRSLIKFNSIFARFHVISLWTDNFPLTLFIKHISFNSSSSKKHPYHAILAPRFSTTVFLATKRIANVLVVYQWYSLGIWFCF